MIENHPTVREPRVLLHDLTGELLWTRALRTPGLALRPGRVLLGMGAVFLASLVDKLAAGVTGRPSIAETLTSALSMSLAGAADAVGSLSVPGLVGAVAMLALMPGQLLVDRPWETLLVGLPVVAVFALFGGAISRGAAVQFAAARITEWPENVGVSGSKLGWSLAGLLGPLALAGLLVGVVVLGGFTLGVPVVNILGGLLYAVALGLSLLALLIMVMHALALPMIVPALMCEGTDAFDAVQRCYAYVIARPLRLLVHAGILLLLGAVSIAVFSEVAQGSIRLTDWAASRLNSDAGVRVLEGGPDLEATQPAAHGIIAGWRGLVAVVVAGFAFSYFFTAGTVLYLIARRICDGQGVGDIWTPEAGDRDA